MAQSLLHDALRERFAEIIHNHTCHRDSIITWVELKRNPRWAEGHSAIRAYALADKLIDEMNRMAPDTASEAA